MLIPCGEAIESEIDVIGWTDSFFRLISKLAVGYSDCLAATWAFTESSASPMGQTSTTRELRISNRLRVKGEKSFNGLGCPSSHLESTPRHT